MLAGHAHSRVAAVRFDDDRHVRLMSAAPWPRDGMAGPRHAERRRRGDVRDRLDVEGRRAPWPAAGQHGAPNGPAAARSCPGPASLKGWWQGGGSI